MEVKRYKKIFKEVFIQTSYENFGSPIVYIEVNNEKIKTLYKWFDLKNIQFDTI